MIITNPTLQIDSSDPIVELETIPMCDLKRIREIWDQISIEETWAEKIHHWCSFESAPSYGKKQNYIELMGVQLLIPFNLWFGVFLIKQKENVDWNSLLLQKITAVFLIVATFPITFLGATIKGIGELLPHSEIECDDSSKTKTHPLIINTCYQMTKLFIEACNEIEFNRFFPIDGTLLGAVRDGGMIAWDDDIDLAFDVSDYSMLSENLKPSLEQRGIIWEDTLYNSFKVIKLSFTKEKLEELYFEYVKNNPDDQLIPIDFIEHPPLIDFCGTSLMSDGSWASDSVAGRTMFPMDYIPLESADEKTNPRQYIQFGKEIIFPTFSNETIVRFLKTYYGDDCLTYGIQTHRHGSISTCWGSFPIPKFSRAYRFRITTTENNE